MGDARPGKAGFSKLADEHSMTVKVPEAQYRKLMRNAQEGNTTPTAIVRTLIADYVKALKE